MRIVVFLCGILLLDGCAAGPAASNPSPGSATETRSSDPWLSLQKGETTEHLRATLGAPAETRPMKSQEGPAEIWTYRRSRTVVNQVAASTEDMPYVDPFSGEMRTIQRPVYTNETRTVDEELQVLVFDGKVVTWKRASQTSRTYD